jgi:hypothetical protein
MLLQDSRPNGVLEVLDERDDAAQIHARFARSAPQAPDSAVVQEVVSRLVGSHDIGALKEVNAEVDGE